MIWHFKFKEINAIKITKFNILYSFSFLIVSYSHPCDMCTATKNTETDLKIIFNNVYFYNVI